ncbi:hypothetical protein C2G38_2046413 [Gigaspora rosea]|uniref:Uncharacterized protein n=1 Tax=Gigaspora rosea TaxID=44941 RepID=A0A397UCQ5_9GLOM|nr:hypothetical protein C2G38_2046413 [Gigaspora rosea]
MLLELLYPKRKLPVGSNLAGISANKAKPIAGPKVAGSRISSLIPTMRKPEKKRTISENKDKTRKPKKKEKKDTYLPASRSQALFSSPVFKDSSPISITFEANL